MKKAGQIRYRANQFYGEMITKNCCSTYSCYNIHSQCDLRSQHVTKNVGNTETANLNVADIFTQQSIWVRFYFTDLLKLQPSLFKGYEKTNAKPNPLAPFPTREGGNSKPLPL